jgi:hypothetical protein
MAKNRTPTAPPDATGAQLRHGCSLTIKETYLAIGERGSLDQCRTHLVRWKDAQGWTGGLSAGARYSS